MCGSAGAALWGLGVPRSRAARRDCAPLVLPLPLLPHRLAAAHVELGRQEDVQALPRGAAEAPRALRHRGAVLTAEHRVRAVGTDDCPLGDSGVGGRVERQLACTPGVSQAVSRGTSNRSDPAGAGRLRRASQSLPWVVVRHPLHLARHRQRAACVNSLSICQGWLQGAGGLRTCKPGKHGTSAGRGSECSNPCRRRRAVLSDLRYPLAAADPSMNQQQTQAQLPHRAAPAGSPLHSGGTRGSSAGNSLSCSGRREPPPRVAACSGAWEAMRAVSPNRGSAL